MKILFWLSLVLILHTFIIYPLSLMVVEKFYKQRDNITLRNNYIPNVSFIIAAHNEEKVIKNKLENTLKLNYSPHNLEIIVASDNSNDNTNKIIKKFINDHKGKNDPKIKLYIVKERKGKTNAQNEAVREASGEILAFSDANTMWKEDSLKKLVVAFKDNDIGYICGRLQYINDYHNLTAESESTYWNYDLKIREWESKIASITAGNGAIYAIRKSDYEEIDPIRCHDGNMPSIMVIKNKKAKYIKEAVAFEKAGETIEDEFKRKVRMFRGLPWNKYTKLSRYNFFKHGWFSYFYFSHRFLRQSLYMLHLLLLFSNIYIYDIHFIYQLCLIGQVLFYSLAIMGFVTNIKNKLFSLPYYYSMTIIAQFIAVCKSLLGKNKAFWEKAESTR
ncbi:MAG: glycosyltransferase family 2 protein [bacterium]